MLAFLDQKSALPVQELEKMKLQARIDAGKSDLFSKSADDIRKRFRSFLPRGGQMQTSPKVNEAKPPRWPVPRRAIAILDHHRNITAREVVPAIACHLGHRPARLHQVGGQRWPGGQLH